VQILADRRLADAIHRRALAYAPRLSYIPEKLEAIKFHLDSIVLEDLMMRQQNVSIN